MLVLKIAALECIQMRGESANFFQTFGGGPTDPPQSLVPSELRGGRHNLIPSKKFHRVLEILQLATGPAPTETFGTTNSSMAVDTR